MERLESSENNPEKTKELGDVSDIMSIVSGFFGYKKVLLETQNGEIKFGEYPFREGGFADRLIELDEKIENTKEYIVQLEAATKKSLEQEEFIRYWKSNLEILEASRESTMYYHQAILSHHKEALQKLNEWIQRLEKLGISISIPDGKFTLEDILKLNTPIEYSGKHLNLKMRFSDEEVGEDSPGSNS